MPEAGQEAPDFSLSGNSKWNGGNRVRSCWIGILLALGLTIFGFGGGGSDSSTNATTTSTSLTVGSVEQCLRAGGATNVNGSAQGNSGTVSAHGPGGGRIFIGLYPDAAQAEKLSQEDAATFPTGTFESVGSAVVGLAKFTAEDRELAMRCAGGS